MFSGLHYCTVSLVSSRPIPFREARQVRREVHPSIHWKLHVLTTNSVKQPRVRHHIYVQILGEGEEWRYRKSEMMLLKDRK